MNTIQNYGMANYQLKNNTISIRNSHPNFKSGKKKVVQTIAENIEKSINQSTASKIAAGAAVTGVTASTVLGQLKKNDNSLKTNTNLAKIPDSVEEMKARLTYNTPANPDEIKDHVKFMENFINNAVNDIESTKYVEFTGVNTPNSKFTLYEPDKNGKYHITRQSKDPDFRITSTGGIYDFYYDKDGNLIGETYYNSKTKVREETRVIYNDISIVKYYNSDGTVKGYRFDDENGKGLEYDANGEVTVVRAEELSVKNTGEHLKYISIERTPSEFADIRNKSKWTTDANGNTIVEFKKGMYIYKGQVDSKLGLINVVKLGKATPPKTEMSPEKAKILANAGFTEEVIGNLKLKSDFYGPKLIDEVLDMVVYLEAEIAKGTPITKDLVEKTIDKFSPGASGASAACQRSILAYEWNKGNRVIQAYK